MNNNNHVMFNLYKNVKRLFILIIGLTVLLCGIVLLFLPGPAFIVIPLGLAILATEFVWARILLKRMKEKIQNTKDKIQNTIHNHKNKRKDPSHSEG